MVRGPELSDSKRETIIALVRMGHKYREVCKQVGCVKSTVSKVVKQQGQPRKKQTGRPKVLSPRDERLLWRSASNNITSCATLKAELGLHASRSTIQRAIRRWKSQNGMPSRKAPCKSSS
eukprot:scaffold630_cov188-Ochromonas_danica.AAC.19